MKSKIIGTVSAFAAQHYDYFSANGYSNVYKCVFHCLDSCTPTSLGDALRLALPLKTLSYEYEADKWGEFDFVKGAWNSNDVENNGVYRFNFKVEKKKGLTIKKIKEIVTSLVDPPEQLVL